GRVDGGLLLRRCFRLGLRGGLGLGCGGSGGGRRGRRRRRGGGGRLLGFFRLGAFLGGRGRFFERTAGLVGHVDHRAGHFVVAQRRVAALGGHGALAVQR